MSSDSRPKFLILVPDGMADATGPEVESETSLGASKTPSMDQMAAKGLMGITHTVPEGMDPGSDVANLSIMGYPPKDVYTGRAPFEAASMGIWLGPNDLAFRMNFVTLERNFTVMGDHSADHISTAEAHEIASYLNSAVEEFGLNLYPGVSYRNLLVWRNGPVGCITHAPHDFPGELIYHHLPSGPGADVLLRLIVKSWKLLENHPLNQRRRNMCQGPANSVWPWGQGKPPRLRTLKERFGLSGSVVAAVDLIRGIGAYAGLDVVDVPGATGYLDTNYAGKVEAALNAFKDKDFVFLHVEAPDEASHSGQRDLKIKAIEDFDEKIVGPILEGLEAFPDWTILLMPDHQTPVTTRVHTPGPVPFILLQSEKWRQKTTEAPPKFSEELAISSGTVVDEASNLMGMLLGRS